MTNNNFQNESNDDRMIIQNFWSHFSNYNFNIAKSKSGGEMSA